MHHPEYHFGSAQPKLNWLRASVMGANDGIVSIAGLVFGIAGATTDSTVLFTTGIAGIVAGAISMAVGEYVSVSSSRDSEQALLAKEKYELEHFPDHEFDELKGIYATKGLSEETAQKVAEELTAHNAFAAHAEAELNIDPEQLTNPVSAAIASASTFFAGALIPLVAITLPPEELRVPVAFSAVVLALCVTGFWSASIGGANRTQAVIRVVLGGILAMAITYGIGAIVGTAL
ncbi:VIT family protein [Patescibacteria group bacterium]|nr:VIT family protein [Patescibacteria group bacterium]